MEKKTTAAEQCVLKMMATDEPLGVDNDKEDEARKNDGHTLN